ncbi:MAG: BatD family protein [Planctomycetes bacterium]|nr:BatD family protein [Planctomycetota bacterium]
MNRIVVIVLLVASVLTLIAPEAQAQSASVNARLSATAVKLGGDTKLVIEVENAGTASIVALPELPNVRFGAIGQPSVQQFISIVNGRQTQSRSLSWVIAVQPLAKGEYTIPQIAVDVDGRRLLTRELSFKAVEDIQGDEFGLFEIDAPQEVVEGQPFTLEMRFGWDSSLTRQINYAKLSVPWLGGMGGLLELDPPPIPGGVQTTQLILNERTRITAENLGEQKIAGRSFLVLRVRKRFIATRATTLELPTSDFEFGRVAQDSFFSRAEPGVSYYKRSPAPKIAVTKLPTEGQPLDFSGGVGNFQVSATADRRQVDAGDSIKLTVDWTGEGNLEFLVPPDVSRLPAFSGFRAYGSNDRKSFERRSVTYDIAPLSADVKEIPSVPLSVFDLKTKTYKTIHTQPIPISVAPLKNASALTEDSAGRDVVVDIRDIQTKALGGEGGSGPGSGVLGATGTFVIAGWLVLRRAVRRRGDPAAPAARERRRARKVLRRSLSEARTASDEARALRRFLAARSGEPDEAWVGRDLHAWQLRRTRDSAAQPVSPAVLSELQRVMERLDAQTWNGNDERLGSETITGIADKLIEGGL